MRLERLAVIGICCVPAALMALARMCATDAAEPAPASPAAEAPEKPADLFTAYSCPDCNIVLVTLDTVRADQLPCYGYARATAPRICAFAEANVLFENAYSAAPMTLPALASIFTGGIPTHDDLSRVFSYFDLRPALPAMLAERGYATAGFTDHAAINPGGGRGSILPLKGFQTFDNLAAGRGDDRSAELTDHALDWLLKNRDQRFFLWVHYFAPHLNYAPRPELAARFGFAAERCGRVRSNMEIEELRAVERTLTPTEIGCLISLHDAEVFGADEQVGRLLDSVAALPKADRTIVAITADHGEEFRERTRIGHEWTLYDELVHVPLALRNPARPERLRIPGTIGTRDLHRILPGMIAGEQVTVESDAFMRTYHYYVTEETQPTRPNSYAIVSGTHKLVLTPAAGEKELFDLAADPGENRGAADRDTAERLGKRLREWIAKNAPDVPPPRPELMQDNAATNEVLRRLGYVR